MTTVGGNRTRYGSLIFCSQCANLLDLPGDDDEIVCEACGLVEDARVYENQVIITRSNPSAFPSTLRQKKTSLVQQREIDKKKVYVDEVCEKCGNKQMSVKTMQLRSADEGATVFYSCEKCGHQARLNN